MDKKRRTVITVAIMAAVSVLALMLTFGFRDIRENRTNQVPDSLYSIQTFTLPDELYFAGERVPLENFDTRESLEREILISAYRHSSTILIIKRAGRYLPVIEKILKENNIPEDFKYLAAAESDYSNMVSPVGATGFWQIMAETGREQGMEVNTVVDERYHVEKSTKFACDFFRKSYEKYGSWTLAAASYNGGRRRMDEQIGIQNQKNYYDLLLAEETARYIFRAIAYKLIISDPKAYGFDIEPGDLYPELKYYEVRVDTSISDFSKFADHFGTNYKMLKYLNPWLRKPYLTPGPNKVYTIKIPSEGMRTVEKTEVDSN